MLASIQAHAEIAKAYIQPTWTEVVLPAAQGLIAYVERDWITAANQLQSVSLRLHEIGGSHAQRDLFEQIYLDALIQSNKHHEAHELLEKRALARNIIPSNLQSYYQQSYNASRLR